MSKLDNIFYTLFCIGAGLVHVIYVILGVLLHNNYFLMYNIFSVLFYITIYMIRNLVQRREHLYRAILVEIVTFSCISTILISRASGFFLYIVSLIPMVFYLVLSLRKSEHIIKRTLLYLLPCLMIIYLIALVDKTLNINVTITKPIELIIFSINLTSSLVVTIGFQYGLIAKNLACEKRLRDENTNLEKLVMIDELTGLNNRHAFDLKGDKLFKQAIATDNDFAVFMIDIDDFKHINDTYGHDVGDLVLQSVAKTVKKSLRGVDEAYRWGGEEVLILLDGDEVIAKLVAERLRYNIENSVVVCNGNKINITVTVGVSCYKQGKPLRTMITEADKNLYRGKRTGKNKVVI